jgi:hypothetical protein
MVSETIFLKIEYIYQRGESVSTYSLFKGAAEEDVRYIPRTPRAIFVRESFGGGPRKEIKTCSMPFRKSEHRWQNNPYFRPFRGIRQQISCGLWIPPCTWSFDERTFPFGWTRTHILVVLDATRINLFLNHNKDDVPSVNLPATIRTRLCGT